MLLPKFRMQEGLCDFGNCIAYGPQCTIHSVMRSDKPKRWHKATCAVGIVNVAQTLRFVLRELRGGWLYSRGLALRIMSEYMPRTRL